MSEDPCAGGRTAVGERAGQALRHRRSAEESARRLRDARRAWNEASEALQEAHRDTDVARFEAAKEQARVDYRSARTEAPSPVERRKAAEQWLVEIDRLNRARGRAVARVARGGTQLARMVHAAERLTVEADAARISAEAAELDWREARMTLAACEESDNAPLMLSDLEDERPLIMRLLDGDRQFLPRVGAALAFDAGIDDRRTQLLLSELVEAINASALDATTFDFPRDHTFWGEFSPEECRAVTKSLRSLGYASDGAGGWLHGRVPMQRDISMAIAHIGLDPRRLRHLPTGVEIQELFRNVQLRGDRFLVKRAPDLSLTGMLGALGPRGDGLSPLWDSWGRLRPLLMTTGDISTIE